MRHRNKTDLVRGLFLALDFDKRERPARPRARIRTCRMNRAGLCGSASLRPARFRIEPCRRGKQRPQLRALDLELAHAPHQKIAALVDIAAETFVARQALEILLRDRS